LLEHAMTVALKIDFVSDVSCPWCAIGLHSLQAALQRLGDRVQATIEFQPFELNPQMQPEGEEIASHLQSKYGSTAAQTASVRESIRQRGQVLGFVFNMAARDRIYNTFDAHRLLHWAGLQGHQMALKMALFKAYFTHGENPGDHAVLLRVAQEVGLDPVGAQAVLHSGAFAEEVRKVEQYYLAQGVHSVPAVIVNNRHLISGGQPPEVFEQTLMQIASS
jgi:predicted DsbA family dithiol-disulfide isomerase